MSDIHLIDINTYFMIVDLAQKHGKKAGESMQEEFEELRAKYPEKFQYLGFTDKDTDQLTGDLREFGLRVFNPKENERREENEN